MVARSVHDSRVTLVNLLCRFESQRRRGQTSSRTPPERALTVGEQFHRPPIQMAASHPTVSKVVPTLTPPMALTWGNLDNSRGSRIPGRKRKKGEGAATHSW